MRTLVMLVYAGLFVSIGGSVQVRADDSGYVRINLQRVRNYLTVPAKINGHSADLLIDTGAAVCVLSSRKDWAFGFTPIKGAAVSLNGKKGQVTRIGLLEIGPTQTRNLPVALIDFHRSGLDGLDGIIGLDLLRAARATVDCQRGVLYWKLDPKAPNVLAATLPRAGWTAIPMEYGDRHFMIRGVVCGKPIRLGVDTGAPVTSVLQSWAAGTGLQTGVRHFTTGGVNNLDRKATLASSAKLAFGTFQLSACPIVVNQTLPGLGSGGVCDGLIGADILGRNLGMIDCEMGILYLKATGL
jgi:predicted aspartyl protease